MVVSAPVKVLDGDDDTGSHLSVGVSVGKTVWAKASVNVSEFDARSSQFWVAQLEPLFTKS